MPGHRWVHRTRRLDLASEALCLHASRGNAQLRPHINGLDDDAITLCQLQEMIDPILVRIGFEFEGDANGAEADRRLLAHAVGAAKIDVAFRFDEGVAQRNSEAPSTRP